MDYYVPSQELSMVSPEFSQHLAEYVLFYLKKRIHQSLDKMTPVDYLIKKGGMSHLYGTYTVHEKVTIHMRR